MIKKIKGLWGKSILNDVSIFLITTGIMLVLLGMWRLRFHFPNPALSVISILAGLTCLFSDWRTITQNPKTVGLVTILGERTHIIISGFVILCRWFGFNCIEMSLEQIEEEFDVKNAKSKGDRIPMSGKVYLGWKPKGDGTSLERYIDLGGKQAVTDRIEADVQALIEHVCSQLDWETIQINVPIGPDSLREKLFVALQDGLGKDYPVEIVYVDTDLDPPDAIWVAAQSGMVATLVGKSLQATNKADIDASQDLMAAAQKAGKPMTFDEALKQVRELRAQLAGSLQVIKTSGTDKGGKNGGIAVVAAAGGSKP